MRILLAWAALMLLVGGCRKEEKIVEERTPPQIQHMPGGGVFEGTPNPTATHTVATVRCVIHERLTVEVVGNADTCAAITGYIRPLEDAASRTISCPACPSCELQLPATLVEKFEQKLDADLAKQKRPTCGFP